MQYIRQVELDQHQVDVCSHCSRKLYHIVVLLHQVNQLIIVNDQVGGKRICLIAPKNWYKYGSEMVRPYKIRIHPPCAKDEKKLRRYYESKLAALPDVMDVVAVVDFTGYNRRTVCQWIRVGKLKALALLQKYMIPKCYLIDWLCSDDYNNTNRKSRRHIDMLWEAQKWNDMR